VAVEPEMYGRVRKIWNHLARQAIKDFIVLLGDETLLKDCNWHEKVVAEFHQVAESSRIPFGAACLALNDESFPLVFRLSLSFITGSISFSFASSQAICQSRLRRLLIRVVQSIQCFIIRC
jgi:hypothetical protein